MGTKFLYKNPIESEESSPVVFVQQREGRSMMGCEYLAMSPPGIIVDDDYVRTIHSCVTKTKFSALHDN